MIFTWLCLQATSDGAAPDGVSSSSSGCSYEVSHLLWQQDQLAFDHARVSLTAAAAANMAAAAAAAKIAAATAAADTAVAAATIDARVAITAAVAAVAAAAAMAAFAPAAAAMECCVVSGSGAGEAGPPEALFLATLPIVVPVVVPVVVPIVALAQWGLEAGLVLQAASFAELPHWSSATRDAAAIPVLSPCEQFDLIIAADCLYFPDQVRKRCGRALVCGGARFGQLCSLNSTSYFLAPVRRRDCWRRCSCACDGR